MSADLLARAAQTLRDGVENAASYTHADPADSTWWAAAARNWCGPFVGEFYALMSPEMALALADWLDRAAELRSQDGPGVVINWRTNHAVAVARAILRERP